MSCCTSDVLICKTAMHNNGESKEFVEKLSLITGISESTDFNYFKLLAINVS